MGGNSLLRLVLIKTRQQELFIIILANNLLGHSSGFRDISSEETIVLLELANLRSEYQISLDSLFESFHKSSILVIIHLDSETKADIAPSCLHLIIFYILFLGYWVLSALSCSLPSSALMAMLFGCSFIFALS